MLHHQPGVPAATGVQPHRPLSPAGSILLSRESRIPLPVRWSFLLFLIAIPFETTDLGLASSTGTRLAGLLFFGIYFFYNNPIAFKRTFPPVPRAMMWLLVYLLVFVGSGSVLPDEYQVAFLARAFTLIQLLVFLWLAADLLRNPGLARQAALAYALGTMLLAVGMVLQIPGFVDPTDRQMTRTSALGMNPNLIASMLALGAVIFAGLRLNPSVRFFLAKPALLIMMLPLMFALLKTASRTGIGVLIIGFCVYLVPYWRAKRKLTAYALALGGVAAVFYMMMRNPVVTARWEEAASGNLAGRSGIIRESLGMIAERPIQGWGPVRMWDELGWRVYRVRGETRDAHNLYLHLLMEVGLIGAVPFLIGLWFCAKAAWRARRGNLGLMPAAMLAVALMANVTHTELTRKQFWLILAFAAASGAVTGRRENANPVVDGIVIDGRAFYAPTPHSRSLRTTR
jgi:O-antigen ligase